MLLFPKYNNYKNNKETIYSLFFKEYKKLQKENQQHKWKWLKDINDEFKKSQVKRLRNFFMHPHNFFDPIEQQREEEEKIKILVPQIMDKTNPWNLAWVIHGNPIYHYENDKVILEKNIRPFFNINLFNITYDVFKECHKIIDNLSSYIKSENQT